MSVTLQKDFPKNDVSTLGIIENFLIVNEDYKNIFDPIQKAIIKFKFQPSILLIKIKISNFKFRHKSVSSKDILFEIRP